MYYLRVVVASFPVTQRPTEAHDNFPDKPNISLLYVGGPIYK